MVKDILLLNYDSDILFILKKFLETNGYNVSISNSIKIALKKITEKKYDFMFIDSKIDMVEKENLLQEIKKNSLTKNTIITFLSAKDDITLLSGLNINIDNYILKPKKADILIKKTKSLTKKLLTDDIINIDDNISIDKKKFSIINKNLKLNEIKLTRKEYDILILLLSDEEKVFTRKEIFNNVWGNNFVSEGTLDVHIKKLRDKLNNNYIVTKKGFGYMFKKN